MEKLATCLQYAIFFKIVRFLMIVVSWISSVICTKIPPEYSGF